VDKMAESNVKRREKRRRRLPPREAVELAARALFFKEGYQGVSVDEIARAAGVSKPTLYHHFGGKEELFVHILNSACARLLAPIFDPASETRPVSEVMLDLAHIYTRTVLDPEIIKLHRLFVSEADRFPELSRRYYRTGAQAVYDSLEAFLRARAGTGEIVCPFPEISAVHFTSLVINPMRLQMMFAIRAKPDWDEVDRFSGEAVALFLAGCGRSDLAGVVRKSHRMRNARQIKKWRRPSRSSDEQH
jgi:TetR/AcrR family transcriptional regulator, mexJK operon transcriptional repressor